MLLEVVTPERLLVSEEVEEVIAPGELGQFGVLPGHHPFLAALGAGELFYRSQGRERVVVIGGGFAEVLPDRVTVLADWALFPEEIDPEEARVRKKEAEETLKALTAYDPEYEKARRRLLEAQVLLEAAQRAQSPSSRIPR